MPSVSVERKKERSFDILWRFTFPRLVLCIDLKKKIYVAVGLTMQLKVCNPCLSFFFFQVVSVWTRNVMRCCAAVTHAGLLKDPSLAGIQRVIL